MKRTAHLGILAIGVVALAAGAVLAFTAPGRLVARYAAVRLGVKRTVAERVAQYGPAARARLAQPFERAGVSYPPRRVKLCVFKEEKRVEVYAGVGAGAEGRDDDGLKFITSYAITAASGTAGPKLREGDRQVPEGMYRIESLNPNSLFHLSLRVDYPSAEDRAVAAREGRTGLGGDIMIHGGAASIGCVAIGDDAIEEVFVLAADVGVQNVEVLIAPCDLRVREPAPQFDWVMERYRAMRERLAVLGR